MKIARVLATTIGLITATCGAAAEVPERASKELVYLDASGVIRWRADDREVTLFGANYCLPSSSDYRAAGYLGVDRKKLIDEDVVHFARMGWDGLRLALWGDWENCDREGNLIVNEHLDLFDYLIFRAKERGISMLFTPIHRHTSLWPDGRDSDAVKGFSKHYPASELGTNAGAIRAQQNYLRQILEHVNPYTGTALKNEPSIVFIEMINEPQHHARDLAGSVAYIDALVDAVRSTGCEKLLFHNLSQDFRMAPAIAKSKVQGYSFGWYPTNLVAGRTLTENYLRWVDAYSPLPRPEVARMPSIVYEFDSADMLAAYMYPAMARGFRSAGAQFAAMFAYDMLATAPYNLGWQTHYMNLVYAPRKAVSAVIAAEAMRTLPRGTDYGPYPHNRRFGPFRVSYEEDLSEMVTPETFLHANSTNSEPPAPNRLRKIVGVGRSSIVAFEGMGAYFLDKIEDGHWRLELYPDAVVVQDPFAQRLNYRDVSFRLIWREWPMQLKLPDLGERFSVAGLNEGNSYKTSTSDGSFQIRPGVYLLSRSDAREPRLPVRIGQIDMREFVCPPPSALPLQVISRMRPSYVAGRPMPIEVDIVSDETPREAQLHVRRMGGDKWQTFPMTGAPGYRHQALLPSDALPVGEFEFFVTVEAPLQSRFPAGGRTWSARLVSADEPLTVLEPTQDGNHVFTMRLSGDGAGSYLRTIPGANDDPPTLRLTFPENRSRDRHAISLPIASRIAERGESLRSAKAIRIRARGAGFALSFVERDGATWTTSIPPTNEWRTMDVPLAAFAIDRGFKLPLGYPGNWNYELPSPADRGKLGDKLDPTAVEHVQIKGTTADAISDPSRPPSESLLLTADIANLQFMF